MGRCGVYSTGSGQETVAVSCDHGNELPGSIKGGKLLDYLNEY